MSKHMRRKPLVPSQPELIYWVRAINRNHDVIATDKWVKVCIKYDHFFTHQTGGNAAWMKRARESARKL